MRSITDLENHVQGPGADTIRILVATDNHVGYNERDPIRGDDSWKTFDEVMGLAKKHDVDMVLLAGDLFHENKPSRKSMYNVMRSLRMNCYGSKPCELEVLSDDNENFGGVFNHVNYEDPNINVSIPVFSIHGNHDDPSGEGHLAALDLLQVSGLVNYYGRTPESDNIQVKPVLLQKGHTKLALYGMSNVRDERLHRTFKENRVKFFRPGTQKENWFNLMSVHQNHHAYTDKGYLPENFLPDFLDLIVWGHEHECCIDPRLNPEMNFRVMQPGSSVATSLMPGEAVPKHVAVLNITGKDFISESIRLKTVRPFIMREIVLQDEKGMKALAKKDNNRTAITQHLIGIVQELIEEAKTSWLEAQDDLDMDEEPEFPLPLIRLRVEYTAPEGGKFDCENPQRFSNRFVGKVANVNDVIQFHRKKYGTSRKGKDDTDMPEESVLAQLSIDTVKVEKLVREFLTAQSLSVLPQNMFGDAVSQFVDKDDKHAMEMFLNDILATLFKRLSNLEIETGEGELTTQMDEIRSNLEQMFAAGRLKNAKRARVKPKPAHWDSDMDGEWAAQPGAIVLSDHDAAADEDAESLASVPPKAPAKRGRGGKATGTTRPGAASSRASPNASMTAVKSGRVRGKRNVVEEESEDEDGKNNDEDKDVIMIDDDDDEEDEEFPPRQPAKVATRSAPKRAAAPATKPSARSSTAKPPARQAKMDFSQPQRRTAAPKTTGRAKPSHELSDDEISDDDDAFEAAPATTRSKTRR